MDFRKENVIHFQHKHNSSREKYRFWLRLERIGAETWAPILHFFQKYYFCAATAQNGEKKREYAYFYLRLTRNKALTHFLPLFTLLTKK